ncbi:hypothetical protein ACFQFD_19220 [Halobaculum halobium]|uniref:Aconitase A/isopropylmalate dehydratase small subunit swivel domain-containing protein n=1 Tax=Halobaculum halobium TaxID=3032281 RepID=A0ABD5THC9_9EURY
MRWGVEAIVGESFAEIFQDNCKSLGIPTLAVDHEDVVALQEFIETNPDAGVEVDVREETVRYDGTAIEGRSRTRCARRSSREVGHDRGDADEPRPRDGGQRQSALHR